MPLVNLLPLAFSATLTAALFVQAGEPDPSDSVALYRLEEVEAQIDAVHKSRAQCGPLALWTALHLLGHGTSFEEVVERAPPQEDGIRLDSLVDAARQYEPHARLVEFPAGASIRDLSVPAILVVDQHHAVVLAGFGRTGRDALIIDVGERRGEEVLVEDMDAKWSGIALVFQPSTSRGDFVLLMGVLAGATVLFLLPRLMRNPTAAGAAANRAGEP